MDAGDAGDVHLIWGLPSHLVPAQASRLASLPMIKGALAGTVLLVLGLLWTAPAAHADVRPDESRLRPDTVTLLHYIETNYPEVTRIGGWRPDRIADHPSGRALDIMVDTDTALGDRINTDLLQHRDDLHIRYTLWRVPAHFNHIHACVD